MSKRWLSLDQAFILLLAIDAGIVAGGLMAGRNMWVWIVAYWAILMAKNIAGYITGGRGDGR